MPSNGWIILLLLLAGVFWFYTNSGGKAVAWIKKNYKRRVYASLTAFILAVLVFMYFRP